MDLSEIPVVHEAIVESDHLDRFGHLNVAWYLHFFSEGALALFDRLSPPTEASASSPQASPELALFALEQHIRYHSELFTDDSVSIRARVLGRSEKRLHFMLFLEDGTRDTLSATIEILAINVDLASRRSVPFTEAVGRRIDDIAADHDAIGWPPPLCGVLAP